MGPHTQHLSYPVSLEVHAPERFERVQLVLRILVWIGLGALQQSLGGAFFMLYLLLPIVAAVLISHRGGGGFLSDDARWLTTLLEWVVGVYAYMLFAVDRFPLDTRARPVRLHVQTGGVPSTGRALGRLVTSLPHALLLMVLGIASGLVGLIAAIGVLFSERYPGALRAFQCDVVAYTARLFSYHASLVETYPPFVLSSTGRESQPPASDPHGARAGA